MRLKVAAFFSPHYSPDNSRVLLYKRIFYFEDPGKCPDEKLAEVCDRILKKCAGVPLAIVAVDILC